MTRSQRGIALLIVLWVMAALTVMAFSFSVMTRAESYGTLAFRQELANKFLAEAGIERGLMEIVYRSVNQNQAMMLKEAEVWSQDGTPHTVAMGEGGCLVRIVDEAGKIPLNGLTDASGIILKNLLGSQGVPQEDADVIVDAILDWKDPDDLHRLHGAESEYYLSLAKPYRPRNAGFETAEELILVRGVTPEILYGTADKAGILPFLTLHSRSDRINLHTAAKAILAALPGMDAGTLERILAYRQTPASPGETTLQDLLGAAYPALAPYVSFDPNPSGVYTLEATGQADARRKGHSITATVAFDTLRQYRYLYYKSPAEISR